MLGEEIAADSEHLCFWEAGCSGAFVVFGDHVGGDVDASDLGDVGEEGLGRSVRQEVVF